MSEQSHNMVTPPLVTIGLPVYNGANFLDEAITAIRSQSFRDFELIIGDNASGDDTLTISNRHAAEDTRIVVLKSDSNRGAAWNFNRLVDQARGRYFKWAAHDDVIDETYLERCIAALEHSELFVLAFPSAADIDERGEVIGPVLSVNYAEHNDPARRIAEFCSFETPCVEVFGLVRIDVLRQTSMIGGFTSSDRVLLLELAIRGQFAHVEEVLMYRRQHPTRSIANDGRTRNAWFQTNRRQRAVYPQWNLVREAMSTVVARNSCPPRTRARMSLSVLRLAGRRRRRLVREAVGGSVRAAQSAARRVTVERNRGFPNESGTDYQ